MSINDLSQELIALVISHLDADRLSPYASVSRAFQDAVEAEVFSTISLTSDELQQLEDFHESRPERRAFLSTLELSVILPTYTDEACAWFEREPDRQNNSESFSDSIARTFRILAGCDGIVSNKPIHLVLAGVYSPMDIDHRGHEKWKTDKSEYEHGRRKDLFEHRYEHSYLHLTNATMLPALWRVRSSTLHADRFRHIAPNVGPLLAKRLRFVECIDWAFDDEERNYPQLRKQLRDGLSQILSAWDEESYNEGRISQMALQLRHCPPFNDNFRNADVRNEDSVDHFSTVLGQWTRSSNLVKLELTGPICIGLELFEPADSSWPTLKECYLEISSVRPDGGWYLIRDPETQPDDEDSESEDDGHNESDFDASPTTSESSFDPTESFFEQITRPPDSFNRLCDERQKGAYPIISYRTHPAPEAEALFQAIARAVVNMPKIRRFEAGIKVGSCKRTGYNERRVGVAFLERGVQEWQDESERDRGKRRVNWDIPKDRRMNEQVWREWLGADGVVRYKEW